jgi:hypothetical protein
VPTKIHPAARDAAFQDELLAYCAGLTGVALPADARAAPVSGPDRTRE